MIRKSLSAPLLMATAASLMPIAGMAHDAAPTSDTVRSNTVEAIEGLWNHDELIGSNGQEIPIDGVFLFDDGYFIEQAVMGNPSDPTTEAMAHTGPFVATNQGVTLTAEQQIALSRTSTPPLSFRADQTHSLKVEAKGDHLKLTFGSGTVQTFTRIPIQAMHSYHFAQGRLVLTNERFVLVIGGPSASVSGYGLYSIEGDKITLKAKRWAVADPQSADIRADVTIVGHFDGKTLELPNGDSYAVSN